MIKKNWLIALVVAGLLMWPLISGDRYLLHIGITASIYLVLTIGLFLVTGITSQLNMGQAAFWAIGSYSYGLATLNFGWTFLPATLFAIMITVILSAIFGLPALKVSGIYFAMVTVGLSEIVRIVLLNWRELSGGGMGLRNIPSPDILGFTIRTPAQFYILGVVLAAMCLLITLWILRSHVGLTMKAVGSNETVARALGVNINHFKLLALVVSSSFAALAGAMYAGYYGFLHPDAFTTAQSFSLVQMLVIGGIQSLPGVVVMTPILTYGLEYLRILGEFQMIAYALLLIFFLIFAPQGVGGLIEGYLKAAKESGKSAFGYLRSGKGSGKDD